MNTAVEWSIRAKIADLQMALNLEKCDEAALKEIEAKLDAVLEIAHSGQVGDPKCETC